MQGLRRLGPNAADIVLQTGALRRRISDAKQAEGAIGERVGEVKLQLLEVNLEQQIQDQHAQDLLRAESVAANISANLRGHQVGQDLLFQLRQPVENLGNQAKLQRMLVRNLADGRRWLNAMSRACNLLAI